LLSISLLALYCIAKYRVSIVVSLYCGYTLKYYPTITPYTMQPQVVGRTINIQQNNFSVDKETLARAREQKMKLAQTVSATSLPSIDAESSPEAQKLLEVTRKEENAQSN
jgi:hypothetical protein